MPNAALCLLLPSLGLLVSGVIPNKWANHHVSRLRRFIGVLSGLHLIASAVLLASSLWLLFGRSNSAASEASATEFAIQLASGLWTGLLLDGTSGLMLTLVAFIGWSICRYSVRYLDGDLAQGSYFRWMALTIGSVSLLAISGDLLTLFVAWSLSSLGIHKLLTHYSDRPAARNAAWQKWTVSRAGDLFLLAAGLLIWREFGTLQLSELFAAVENAEENGQTNSSSLSAIGALLVAGAALKTAQFPFHSWLPDTLEAPTPVSALMHAGIVNAGGYLLIRLSPVVTCAPVALSVLAFVGAFTACFAATVMLTQTSIKKSLAWSTIAQMGFMMLQCGLGAFSAAMLHILAHSLYKAHAFLNSSDVLNQAKSIQQTDPARRGMAAPIVSLGFALLATMSSYVGAAFVIGLNPATKPGGLLLGMLLCLGLTRWLWQLMQSRLPVASLLGLTTTAALCFGYLACFAAVDAIVSTGSGTVSPPPEFTLITASTATLFVTLFLTEAWLSLRPTNWQTSPRWLQAVYVHASNGFYVDAALSPVPRAGR